MADSSDGDRTEITFRLKQLPPDKKQSVRDALRTALSAEIRKANENNNNNDDEVGAEHSSSHNSNHSNHPEE